MLRQLIRGGYTLIAAACLLAPAAPAVASPPARFDPPKSYYLALGDSIGYGFQTSKALAGLPPRAFNTGYVDLFSARLKRLRPGIITVNFSCPGESTLSITTPCTWKASGHALHDDYPGSQMDAALAFLAAHRGRVSPITLSLNGNDITAFLQSCPTGDLACIQNGAPAAITQYRTRMTAILGQLRAAAPDAEIILTGAYDPDVGQFSFADPLFSALNDAESMAGPPCGPASPTRSRSSTRKETRQPRPPPSAPSPWCAPSTTATPPTPATGRSPASSGTHPATTGAADAPHHLGPWHTRELHRRPAADRSTAGASGLAEA